MKIAILGGGFAGIAVAWHLFRELQGAARIDIFDPAPVVLGASRISMGILNPFMGKQARYAWKGEEAVQETHVLLTAAAQALQAPLILSKGLLRPALTEEAIQEFQVRAQKYPKEALWWSSTECCHAIPGLYLQLHQGGLYFPQALTVSVDTYLSGLWRSVECHGAQYLKMSALTEALVAEYDHFIMTIGAHSRSLQALAPLPITRIKGQILELEWPSSLPPLPMSLSGEGQIVMTQGNRSCLVGATYEKEFTTMDPDPEFARKEILKKITPFFPAIANAKTIDCRARMRAAAPNHLPLIGRINEKMWFLTGLGSKGLLYHGLAAHQLVRALLANNPGLIDSELRWTPKQSS